MVKHISLGNTDFARKRQLVTLRLSLHISLGGNSKLKTFGRLDCKSGKRMKVDNRVFIKDRDEALLLGYRPCGHCMPNEYRIWKEMQ